MCSQRTEWDFWGQSRYIGWKITKRVSVRGLNVLHKIHMLKLGLPSGTLLQFILLSNAITVRTGVFFRE